MVGVPLFDYFGFWVIKNWLFSVYLPFAKNVVMSPPRALRTRDPEIEWLLV